MKKVTYKFLSAEINHGTEENPDIEQIFLTKEMQFDTEEQFNNALLYIEAEAYNGEYTIEDLGDAEAEPTAQDDTDAMLIDHEYRLTLLELGITESEV